MWKSILILAIFCTCGRTGHVKVSVYYESLCPDSMDFLVNQFYPVYQEHAEHMMTQLIPYGNAKASHDSGSWEFECQHGEGECYGNKIHSCALELYPEEQSFAFIVCSMATGNASLDANLEECSASSNITWTELQECVSSGKGDEYLAANGKITDELIPEFSTFMPTITFNNTFNKQLENLSLIDFQDIFVFLHDQVDCGFCQFIPSDL